MRISIEVNILCDGPDCEAMPKLITSEPTDFEDVTKAINEALEDNDWTKETQAGITKCFCRSCSDKRRRME